MKFLLATIFIKFLNMNRQQALKILELTGNPTDEEVKKAFKMLAKKYHPDLNKKYSSGEKFKEINTAQDILLNKKLNNQNKFQSQQHNTYNSNNFKFKFDQFFNQHFAKDHQNLELKPHPADVPLLFKDIVINIPISINQFIYADILSFKVNVKKACPTCLTNSKYFTICSYCNGFGEITTQVNTPYGTISRNQPCIYCKGKGWVRTTLCPTCNGKLVVDFTREIKWDVKNKKIEFNKKILFRGKGHLGHKSKPSNLYIIPTLLKPELKSLSTKENDLLKELLKKI